MATGNIYRGAVRGHMGTVEWVNTLYFKQIGVSSDLGSLAAAIDSTIYEAMHTLQGPTWRVDDITLSELVVGGGEQLVEPSTTVGTNGIGVGSTTDAAVISFRTALAGRSHRGRNYFPVGIQNGVLAGGVISAFTTPLLAAYNAFKAIYGVGGSGVAEYEWGIWSRKLGETLDGSGHVTAYNPTLGFFQINRVLLDTTARVQRRRELGVGV